MKTLFDYVKDDLDTRNRIGWETYKKELFPDDAVDYLLEAYQEALDTCIYLKGELLKRERAALGSQTEVASRIRAHASRTRNSSPLPPNGKA